MNKVKEQKGFTLVEMLIVVAIIAILVAVSIPLVGSALEHSRETTDAAIRDRMQIFHQYSVVSAPAFVQPACVKALETDTDPIVELGKPYCYDAVNGKLVTSAEGIEAYGKGRGDAGAHKNLFGPLSNDADHQGCYLWGHIGNTDNAGNTDYSVYMGWSSEKTMLDTGRIDASTLTGPWLQ